MDMELSGYHKKNHAIAWFDGVTPSPSDLRINYIIYYFHILAN